MADDSILGAALQADPYLALDDSIRMVVSRREWNFMTDDQKARLELELCEPDPENY